MQTETNELHESTDVTDNNDDTCNKIRVRSDSSLFNNELEKEEQPMDVDNNGEQEHEQGIQNGNSEVADVNEDKSPEAVNEENSSAANKTVSLLNTFFRALFL